MQKFGWLGILFFLMLMFLFQIPTTGQNKKFFIVTGKIVPEIETSEKGTIMIAKSGAEPTKIEIPQNGRFRLELEYFNEYTLTFSLAGHFSKTIIVSTDIPQEVWKRDNDFPPFPMIVQLFKEIEGIDKSFTLKPSGRVFYGKQTDNFEKESIFNDIQIAEQIQTATTQAVQVKKEAQTITKQEALELAAKQKNFDQLIGEADVNFKKGDYPLALSKYQEAQKLFPEKAYANDRIAEIQDLLRAMELTEKRKAEVEQKYKDAIARANSFFDQKTYKEARPVYQEALNYKPDDVFASGRIKEIEQLIAKAEKQKQFDDLILQADKSYKSKKFDQAISTYNQAKLLIPENEYPQNQINLINQEQQQLALAAQQEKEFSKTIQDGDNLAKRKDFIQAINLYKKALEMKPDSKLASDKIAETEQSIAIIETDKKYQETILLADQALSGNDLQKAKLSYLEALKLKSTESYPKNKLAEIALTEANETKFTDLVGKGDAAFDQKDYEVAKTNYTSALGIKPNAADVKTKITNIDVILLKLADDKKKEEERQLALAEKEKAYTNAIAQADKSFDKKDYTSAQSDYRKSLTYKPDETYPTNRIKEIDQIFENEKQAKLLDENFKSVIARADKAFGSESFADARKIYTEALALKPGETYPTAQISKIDGILAEKAKLQQTENDFMAMVGKGDAAFDQKEYKGAKTNYTSALVIKPNAADVKTKIKNIDSILQKLADDKKKEEERQLALAAKEKAYTETIAQADKSFDKKDYASAQSDYRKSLTYKPDETYPTNRIKEIDTILQKIADDKKKEEELQLALAAKEKAYTEAIAQADKSFDKKDYASAQSDYRKSLTYKPDETYPTNRIKEIDQIFENEKQAKLLDENFKSVIVRADKAFGLKSYDDARKIYTEALALKPGETYPTAQISKIDGILAEKAKLQQIENDFMALVSKGDAAFDQKEYEGAKTNYTSALVIKPNAADVKTKIKNIDSILQKLVDDKKKEEVRLLALAAATEKAYTEAIAKGNKLITQKTYSDARVAFQEAKKLKPTETLPDEMITKIDSLIAGNEREMAAARLKEEAYQKSLREAMENSFSEAMTKADKAFNENDFKMAKTGYEAALVIKANDPKAKEKLGLTDAKLAQLAKLTQAYNTAITKANQLVTDKRYPEAKEKYEESLQYLPDSDYPKGQIEKLNGLLAQAATERQKEESYTSSMKEGETLFTNKDYPGARALFAKASELKPAEPLPVSRIKAIDKIMSDLALEESKNKTIEASYQESIKRADKELTDKKFTPARLIYTEALAIKPNEKYPKDKIAEIDQIMADLKVQQYSKAISAGDIAFKANQLEEASSQYELALTVKANDDYAKKQLAEIAKRKTNLQEEQNRLKKLNEQYDALIADAGTDLKNKEYQKSKGKYQNASSLKPSETLPKEQIAKIDELLNEIKKTEETDRLYAESVKTAQDAFKKNKLTEARDAYQKAHDYKPAEPIPPQRIDELNKMIAQLEEAAKLSAMEESQRLAKEKTNKEQYDKAIAAANQAFAEKQYKNSRTEYTNALSVFPNEKYPKDQIRKIDDLIASLEKIKMLSKEQATKDSLVKVRDAAFNLAIASAKESEQAKQYQNAILKYKEAITINANERGNVEKMITAVEEQIRLLGIQDKQYKEKIALADQLRNVKKHAEALAEYQNASKIKPDEEYPKNQITEIQKIIAAEKGIYATAINNGDQAFDKSDWTNAKIAYNEAVKIKPDESYPKNRLLEIDKNILAEKNAAMKDAATTAAFNEAMTKGEKALKDNLLTTAKTQFNVALTLKPNESLPAQRIREIDALIEKKNQENMAKAQLEIAEKYRLSISLADNAFKGKIYVNAKSRYQEAQVIKPDESYPKDQIALIDKLMSETKPAETFSDKMPDVKTAPPIDKPQVVKQPVNKPIINPIETAQAIQARAESYKTVANYDEAIRKADDSFGIKDYSVARFFYYKANELRPNEEYPKNQIELIRKLVDAELSTIDRTGYEQAVSEADGAFKKENYNVARFFYNKALEIKSWEKYPKDRIQEIMALTNSLLSEKEEKAYNEMIAKADEALVEKEIAIARFYYTKAIGIKKEEDYPRIKLKDIQKLVTQDEKDQQNLEYNKLIEQADQALQSENYSIARFNYNKALNMKPDEKYPKDQLKRIKEALDKPKK